MTVDEPRAPASHNPVNPGLTTSAADPDGSILAYYQFLLAQAERQAAGIGQ